MPSQKTTEALRHDDEKRGNIPTVVPRGGAALPPADRRKPRTATEFTEFTELEGTAF
jgi:hypothetical protein